jgi:NADH:ubiquinone oxidoreductase subunit
MGEKKLLLGKGRERRRVIYKNGKVSTEDLVVVPVTWLDGWMEERFLLSVQMRFHWLKMLVGERRF